MTYKPTGKCLVPGILHFRLHEWTLFNCTITVCLKTHFQVCPENGTKKKKQEKKLQQLCQGCDLVTLQLHKLFDATFVFHFAPEAAFPASAVGDGKCGLRVCACVWTSQPPIQRPSFRFCHVHMDAEVILFYTMMCGCAGRKRESIHCEPFGAFQTEVHVKFI